MLIVALILLSLLWLGVSVVVVALCQMASRDRQQRDVLRPAPGSSPVDLLAHVAEPTSHPVDLLAHAAEPRPHPVDLLAHAAEPRPHQVDLLAHTAEPTSHPVDLLVAHAVKPRPHQVKLRAHGLRRRRGAYLSPLRRVH